MRIKIKTPYRTYLLRCWREDNTSPNQIPMWRFSVEEVLGKRGRRGFASFEEVVAFLRKELTDPEDEM
jgi:hypothetical protein